MTEWDGQKYDALPLPHQEWGKRTIAALNLLPNETLLDAGCGTGRDAQVALEILAAGKLICVDQSENMLDQCRAAFGNDPRVTIARGDLDKPLPVTPNSVDAIMSVATLHWLSDHKNVWQNFYTALKPGGRIVTDSGGFGNLDRILELALQLFPEASFPDWTYANVEDTTSLLIKAGFANCNVELRPYPAVLPSYKTLARYLHTVVFKEWPLTQIETLANEVTNNTVDFVRLEVMAYKP
jgi:trans-aconitate 2-methyltransferase